MLVHLSDLHFGAERQECLDAISRFCMRNRVDVVVVSGDLTQRARFSQFYRCKQFLDALKLPYIVVPGNHDIPLFDLWTRIKQPFNYYRLFFGALEQQFETEHFYILGLNSIRPRFHSKGAVSEQQITQISELLRAAPQDKKIIIVSHQPFYTADVGHHHLKDCPDTAQRAMRCWADTHAPLFALLHGHLHMTAVHDLNQVFDLGLKQPIYELHVGSSSSYRLYSSYPNSLNTISATGEIHHYIYDEDLHEFLLYSLNDECIQFNLEQTNEKHTKC